MLVRLENPGLLSRVVEIISELVTEVRMKVNESGLSITAMDPANVSMVKFVLPKSSFSMFETDNEVLGINLESLKSVLKRCSLGSSLNISKEDNLIKLKCTVCKSGVYYSSKNKKLVTKKLEYQKYCKVCRKQHPFKEVKLTA